MKNRTMFYLLVCFLITLFCGLVYVSVGQSLRLSADDPQLQIAQEVLGSLNQGADPKQLSSVASDMSTSLAAFVIIYDNKEKVAGTTTELDKKAPVPSSGIFENVKKNNESRFTWEPKKGVRSASIMVKYKDGFVLVGKSLKEVENRIKIIAMYVGVAWVLGIGFTSFIFLKTRPIQAADAELRSLPAKRPARRLKK